MPKRKLGRRLFILLLILLLIPSLLLFTLTRPAVLRGVILPRVADALDADLTVSNIRLRPFSGLWLQELSFRDRGGLQQVDIAEAQVQYRLLEILRGTITVDLIELRQPRIALTLPPPDAPPPPATPPPAAADTAPPRLNIARISIQDGAIAIRQPDTELRLTDLNFELHNLVSGLPATLSFSTLARLQQQEDVLTLSASLAGTFLLDETLTPQSLALELNATLEEQAGAFAQIDSLNRLNALLELTPTTLKRAELNALGEDGEALGRIHLSGPMNPARGTAALSLDLELPPPVFQLIGAATGLDLGQSRLSGQLALQLQPEQISLKGELTGRDLQIRHGDLPAPVFSLRFAPDVEIHPEAQVANLKHLQFSLTEQEGPAALTFTLSEPMDLDWSGETPQLGDAEISLALKALPLSWLNALLPDITLAGLLEGELALTARDQGQDMTLLSRFSLENAGVQTSDLALEGLRLSLAGQGKLREFQALNLQDFLLQASQGDTPLLRLSAEQASAHLETGAVQAQLQTQVDLAAALRLLPLPELTLQSGRLAGGITLARESADRPFTAAVQAALTPLQGRMGDVDLTGLHARAQLQARLGADSLSWREGRVTLQRGTSTLGLAQLDGHWHIADQTLSDTRIALQDLSIPDLLAWLQPEDTPPFLGTLQAEILPVWNSTGAFAAPLTLQLSGLQRRDAPGETAPLDLQLAARIEGQGSRITLPPATLNWTPTAESENRLTLSGEVDLTNPEALRGALRVEGTPMDLSQWYALLTPTAGPQPDTPAAPAAALLEEPPPVRLPLERFTAEIRLPRVQVDEVIVRDLDLNLLATAGEIALNRLRLTVNDAPVEISFKSNLTVPGSSYALNASVAPLDIRPLVTTFVPELSETLSGIFQARVAIQGQGVTGASIREHLQGSLQAELREGELRWSEIEQMDQAAVRTAHRLVVALLRAAAPALGVPASDLLSPPLHEILVQSRIGDGRLSLETLRVSSNAFRLSAAGVVDLASDLDQSPIRDLPIGLALAPDLARRARLFREDRLQDDMIALPPFIRLRGTLGEPEIDVRRSVITGLIAGGLVETDLIRSDRVRDRLEGIGGILTGEGPRPTPTPRPDAGSGTAAPAPTPAPTPAPASPQPTPTPRPGSRTDRVLRGLDRLGIE